MLGARTRESLRRFLEEDFGETWRDVSGSVVEDRTAEAVVATRDSGVVAGLEEAEFVFEEVGASAEGFFDDGDGIEPGDTVMRVDGPADSVLRGERLALNLVGSMSGVATVTRRCVNEVEKAGSDTTVAATRKTTPGYRSFEKKAVRLGDGDTHRYDLTDAVMLKENQIEILGLETAYRRAREAASFTQKVEVEAEEVGTAVKAAELGADIVMLDNMEPDEVEDAVERLSGYDVVTEASGGITPENVAEYASTGVDVASLGSLVHSSDWLDLSLTVDN
ncbi:MAG: carboxylating nicotinate-nucleotide diphosphorylase [Halobacteria archaeon]|nr:carboxylating nicotinate-nucleotide diphosphorylase [Halobacteria archaeon]